MALVPFPPLEPIAGESGRELKLGKFANRRYDERHGASSDVRNFGNLSFGQELTISFGVVPDTSIVDVWDAWDAAYGDTKPLLLPEKFFFGIHVKPTWAKHMLCHKIGGHNFCKEKLPSSPSKVSTASGPPSSMIDSHATVPGSSATNWNTPASSSRN
jgi:hypothetical protein